MTPFRIPFNRSSLAGREQDYITEAMAIGQIAGDQAFTKKCHELLESKLGVRKTLLTTSCTHALEMSALLLNIQPGDEVIVPSFTFVSTVNAFVLRGAKPVFADVRPRVLRGENRRNNSRLTTRNSRTGRSFAKQSASTKSKRRHRANSHVLDPALRARQPTTSPENRQTLAWSPLCRDIFPSQTNSN